jgi:NTP pyrophosphatase (non-canonical NTP hydrolase)
MLELINIVGVRMSEFRELTNIINRFTAEREWETFHSPKNLAMALSVEASELVEHFQWLTEEESRNLDAEKLSEVADEIADVQWYLLRIADQLSIDIPTAAKAKMIKNGTKYPVALAKGNAKKYNRYQDE